MFLIYMDRNNLFAISRILVFRAECIICFNFSIRNRIALYGNLELFLILLPNGLRSFFFINSTNLLVRSKSIRLQPSKQSSRKRSSITLSRNSSLLIPEFHFLSSGKFPPMHEYEFDYLRSVQLPKSVLIHSDIQHAIIIHQHNESLKSSYQNSTYY